MSASMPEGVIPAYLGGEKAFDQRLGFADHPGGRRCGHRARRHRRDHRFRAQMYRPWIDSGQEHGYEDVFTIAQIGDLKIKLHAAEALLERAARAIDAAFNDTTEEGGDVCGRGRCRGQDADDRNRHSRHQQAARTGAARDPRSASSISTAIGEMPAPIRCTIPCAGNISMSATTRSTARPASSRLELKAPSRVSNRDLTMRRLSPPEAGASHAIRRRPQP